MPVARMRMRPWLEQQIESQAVAGLTWLDKDKMMFSIPWKHAARHGWELNKDACLFKQWAIHTGKYVEGQACDPKTWKANFRCAMNSLPDIEEVKDKSVNKGHQAVRVFRMLPASPKSRDKRGKAKEAKQRKKSSTIKTEEDARCSATPSPAHQSMLEDTSSTQECTVDSTVHSTEQPDFAFVTQSEVPDWSLSVEVGTNFPNNFCQRFEVSPDHSPDYDIGIDIIQMCQQLEKDTCFNVDANGFLCNEACSSPGNEACPSSPGSAWSESSSVEDLDELPHYTILDSQMSTPIDDLWNCFLQKGSL